MTSPVHVVVPAYDCYDALTRCLASIAAQDYPNLAVTVIDDASPDPRMAETVTAVENDGALPGWSGFVNTHRIGATGNIWNAVHATPMTPDTIIVLVDGDDWLDGADAITRIAAAYDADPNVWLAYGSYRTEPDNPECHPAEPYPTEVVRARSFRSASNVFNHPLTFRRFLFDQVREEDVRLASGEWVPGIYDEAYMYPMLEMAGPNHRCLPDVVYVYNTGNPLSVNRTQLDAITAAGRELRERPQRPQLFWSDSGLTLHWHDRAAVIAETMSAHGLTFMVETGTGFGDMAERVALENDWVERVITIEVDPGKYLASCNRLLHTPRIQPMLGDSAEILRAIGEGIPRALWWLDAHRDQWWSGNPSTVTPIMDELFLVLNRRRGDVVLVDDARLFGFAPGYPTIAEVAAHIDNLTGGTYNVRVEYDILRAEPKETP